MIITNTCKKKQRLILPAIKTNLFGLCITLTSQGQIPTLLNLSLEFFTSFHAQLHELYSKLQGSFSPSALIIINNFAMPKRHDLTLPNQHFVDKPQAQGKCTSFPLKKPKDLI